MLLMRDVRTDGQTSEDRATQPMDAGWLSFAIYAGALRGKVGSLRIS